MRKSIFIPLIILLLFISGSNLFAVSATCHEIEHSATPIPQNSDSSTKKKDPKKKKKTWEQYPTGSGEQTYIKRLEDSFGVDVSAAKPDMTKKQLEKMFDEQYTAGRLKEDSLNIAKQDSINNAYANMSVDEQAAYHSRTGNIMDTPGVILKEEPPLSSKISNFFSKNIVFIIIIIVVLIIVFLLIVYFSRLKKADNNYPPFPPSSTPDNHNTSTATQQNLKYCTQCGKQIPANAKFCAVCGEKQ